APPGDRSSLRETADHENSSGPQIIPSHAPRPIEYRATDSGGTFHPRSYQDRATAASRPLPCSPDTRHPTRWETPDTNSAATVPPRARPPDAGRPTRTRALPIEPIASETAPTPRPSSSHSAPHTLWSITIQRSGRDAEGVLVEGHPAKGTG